MKMKKPQPEIKFAFQVIPLQEALNALAIGDGNYASLKAMVLEKLSTLSTTNQAFVFGLPDGGKVSEEHRRGITMALNNLLTRASLPWRVKYSETRNLFLCVPRGRKAKAVVAPRLPVSNGAGTFSNAEDFVNFAKQILGISDLKSRRLRMAVSSVGVRTLRFAPKDLAAHLGITHHGVSYNANSDSATYRDYVTKLREAVEGR